MTTTKQIPTNATISSPYDDRFYDGQIETSLESARIYLGHLWKYLEPKSVLDVGCGRGAWLKACHELGSSILHGYDGPWNNQSMMIDSAIEFKAIDLNQPFDVQDEIDLVITLEVAEHLEPSSASPFVKSLTKCSDTVLFGAAFTGQPGTNHINAQPPTYWANLFVNEGHVPFDICRPLFWGNKQVCYFYTQNTFLYLKKNGTSYQRMKSAGFSELRDTAFMDCIHPVLYHHKLAHIESLSSFRGHAKALVRSFLQNFKKRDQST